MPRTSLVLNILDGVHDFVSNLKDAPAPWRGGQLSRKGQDAKSQSTQLQAAPNNDAGSPCGPAAALPARVQLKTAAGQCAHTADGHAPKVHNAIGVQEEHQGAGSLSSCIPLLCSLFLECVQVQHVGGCGVEQHLHACRG